MKFVPDACAEIENSLPLWVGGDLDPGVRSDVERHLARCEPCATRAGEALRARALLREQLAQRAETGPDLWPSIRTTLAAEGRFSPGGGRVDSLGPRRDLWRLWPVAAIAAALLGIWLGGRLMREEPEEPVGKRDAPVVVLPRSEAAPVVPEPIPAAPTSRGGIELVGTGLRRLRLDEPHLGEEIQPVGLGVDEGLRPRPLQPASQDRVFPPR